ncbi:hypothetical protein [Erwinia typographi]|uniref:hypothetical protein n=1 Tax=Erwinia typographi TaxID=371042 RepID=UPI0012ECD5DC|nr:hypothetical protein [Erwinia typographi]
MMGVRIYIDVDCGESAFTVSPEIKVNPDDHTVSEMNIATSTVNYAVQLAAEFNRIHYKAKLIKEEIYHVS